MRLSYARHRNPPGLGRALNSPGNHTVQSTQPATAPCGRPGRPIDPEFGHTQDTAARFGAVRSAGRGSTASARGGTQTSNDDRSVELSGCIDLGGSDRSCGRYPGVRGGSGLRRGSESRGVVTISDGTPMRPSGAGSRAGREESRTERGVSEGRASDSDARLDVGARVRGLERDPPRTTVPPGSLPVGWSSPRCKWRSQSGFVDRACLKILLGPGRRTVPSGVEGRVRRTQCGYRGNAPASLAMTGP